MIRFVQTLPTWMRLALVACLLAIPATLCSAERRTPASSSEATGGASLEMFAAIKAGDIEVSLIPKDSSEARVIIKNKTDKPLNLKLPEAFAGMPILAQRGGVAGRPGQQNNQNQAMGGGMGGMGMGMGGGMGGGMGMMSIPPEKVVQFRVPTVCLEHGKREPRSSARYQIQPIENFSTRPELKELLRVFGREHLNQRATQAAAWHISSGLTWSQLANKRVEHLDGSSEPWFSPQEIQAAMQASQYAQHQAQTNAQRSVPEASSASQSAGADD